MSVKTPPQYTTLQNQTAVAGGTWPQTLTLSPDLSVGGLNVVFQDGKVVEQQTPKGLFSSTGRLFWLQNADLDGVTSFSFQSGVFLHINFWTGSKLVAYFVGTAASVGGNSVIDGSSYNGVGSFLVSN